MKVLILQDDFPPLNIGGAGAVAFSSAKELTRRGHEVEVVTSVRSASDAGIGDFEGLSVHRIYSVYNQRFRAYVSLWNPHVVREVRNIIRDFKPDVVHAHNVHGYLSYASLRVAKESGARVILTCHDVMPFNYGKFVQYIDPTDLSIPAKFDYRIDPWRQLRDERFRYNPLRNFFIREIVRENVDVLVAVSDALREALQQNGFGGATVIHNGIDIASWHASHTDVEEFKKKYALGKRVIFFTGKPYGVKGARKLFAAVKNILHDLPDVQILVAGREDAHTVQLHNDANKLGLSEKVIFTGWLTGNELAKAYLASAVVAVPSLCFDSFPTVNLESFACKKSVVATCFGGSRELVEDDVSGYIVNPFDERALAERLEYLLADAEKQKSFGEAGFRRVTKDFTLISQIEAYENLYSSNLRDS